ncbi:MAG: AAA family ATPase [Methanothrix sp.]|nr:AAA family ATPase [Methanothrix sp.]
MSFLQGEIRSQESTQADLNRGYIQSEMQRLKLLLQRRAMWLRHEWKSDPLQSYTGMVISDDRFDWLLSERCKAEAEFYEKSSEICRIDECLAEVGMSIEDAREAATEAGIQLPLDLLADLFQLTSFERDVLLLAFAHEMDPSFERLIAYIQDDLNRKYPTPSLALEIFGEEGAEMEERRSLMAGATLRRFHLIVLDPGAGAWALQPLRMDERVTDYILGFNHPDEKLLGLLRPLSPAPLTHSHFRLLESIEQWMKSEVRESCLTSLNLVGAKGTGRRAVAAEISSRLGIQIFSMDTTRLPALGADLQEMVQLLERESILAGATFYIELPDGGPPENEARAMEFIEQAEVFMIIGSTRHRHFERGTLSVEVPGLDAGDRLDLWKQALQIKGGHLDGLLGKEAEQFAFGPHDTVRAAKTARLKAGLRGATVPEAEDIWLACKEQAGLNMHDLAQKISPVACWDDIVLPSDALQQLQEISSQVENRQRVYDDWGFGRRLNRGRGINALISGPSGTGKTMAAEVLARHLSLDLYRIDLAGVVSKYIGETEKNLKRIFDAAESSGAVLFFDEADALFGKRTEVKDSHDRYANIEVNYLLQRMEEYSGLAILATNRKSALDQAFLRRLRFLVDLPLPDYARRLMIWQKAFPPEADLDGLDYDLLARMEISGGNIRNISLNAAFLAADEGSAISMGHIMHAARREYAKIGRLVTEAELGKHCT